MLSEIGPSFTVCFAFHTVHKDISLWATYVCFEAETAFEINIHQMTNCLKGSYHHAVFVVSTNTQKIICWFWVRVMACLLQVSAPWVVKLPKGAGIQLSKPLSLVPVRGEYL